MRSYPPLPPLSFQCLVVRLAGSSFNAVLDPFSRIITKSPKLNVALSTQGMAVALIERLWSPGSNAIARLSLLKLLKVIVISVIPAIFFV